MTHDSIKERIALMGFSQQSQKTTVWTKKYSKHDDYVVLLDFVKSAIDYGKKINRGDDTTSNFSNDENFVVLECVDRLLTKGYKPADLTLERKWKLGRSAKSGKADINVKDGKTGKTVLIIECKTWGAEFEKEKDRMRENGGQLFSYFQQDKSTRFLCLYTSQVTSNLLKQEKFIDYKNAVVCVEDTPEEIGNQTEAEFTITYQKSTDISDALKVWEHKNKKEFLDKGIFEDDIEPYNPGFKPKRIKELKEFTAEDAKKEYYWFEEILRHNNISDRSNAFNRFISLVLAKIVDEEKPEGAIADFQNKKGIDTSEELIERLQVLYAKAMKDYLGETVINYTLEDIEKIIGHFPRQTSKEDLKRIYRELKFYSNNEFSFKEVYNRELFEQNAKVLYEVVERLQHFRFKYNAKAQFLGDFFEDMLESGFKQSEGQFFTPTPIAKFMISSIPLREIIDEKIKNKTLNILPTVIDYACGSGHFVTEAIEEIQGIIRKLENKTHKDISSFKASTKWAGDFICGIEKDYRLARTCQVACFMHGDGDAKIIYGDGLEEHLHRLPQAVKRGENLLGFDVLVANPPYTIKDFKKHLNKNKLPKYELLSQISDDSDDIEVMFVERTKQLLKVGGYAGIFLPSTILNSTGIYTKAREIILKYFEIKGIVEFGSNTFSATSTNTIVLFMKRRSEDFSQNCLYIAEDLILGKDTERKEDFIDSKKLLENYSALIGISVGDYQTLVERKPSAELLKTEFYQNYKKWFENLTELKNWKKSKNYEKLTAEQKESHIKNWFFDEVLEIEKEKFFYFLLSHKQIEKPVKGNGKKTIKEFVPQQTLIIKSGKDNETQKAFLGYTFSDRRGYKGLDMKKDASGKEITKLYDKENLRNPEKANTYIYKAFREEPITEIPETLKEHITPINLVDTFDFERIEFEKQINTITQKKIKIETKWDMVSLGEVIYEYAKSNIQVREAKNSKDGTFNFFTSGEEVLKHNKFLVDGKNIFLSTGGNAIVKFFDGKASYSTDTYAIKSNNEEYISTNFIFYFLTSIISEINSNYFKGVGLKHLQKNEFRNIKIPVPPIDVQDRIVKEIEKVEQEENLASSKFLKVQSEIQNKINSLYNSGSYSLVKIKNQFNINEETVNPTKIFGENLFTYIDIDCIGKGNGKISFHKQVKGVEAASRARRIAKNKSAVISTVRPYLKGFAFIEEVPENSVFSTGFAIIRSKDEKQYLTELLYYMFMYSENLMQQIEAKMPKASYPSINQADIDDFQIPLIPIKEQEKTLSQIKTLQASISEAQNIIEKAENNKLEILKKNLK